MHWDKMALEFGHCLGALFSPENCSRGDVTLSSTVDLWELNGWERHGCFDHRDPREGQQFICI